MRRQEQRLAVGYLRVSIVEQGQSGLGLEAQRASVQGFVASQGWTLVAEYEDVASDKDDRRPGLQAALVRCRQLGAVLIAAQLDRTTLPNLRRRCAPGSPRRAQRPERGARGNLPLPQRAPGR